MSTHREPLSENERILLARIKVKASRKLGRQVERAEVETALKRLSYEKPLIDPVDPPELPDYMAEHISDLRKEFDRPKSIWEQLFGKRKS